MLVEEKLKELKQKIDKETYLDSTNFSIESGKIYYAHNIWYAEDHNDIWDELCEAQNELQLIGYHLVDVYTEHDFVGGYVEEIKNE